jgi:hypothetical protein
MTVKNENTKIYTEGGDQKRRERWERDVGEVRREVVRCKNRGKNKR